MRIPKIAIIGAGPAGMAASIQLKRYGYQIQLFEKDIAGGLLWNANLLENYPGFPNGISGPELIKLMVVHLKKLNIEIERVQINHLSFENEVYHLVSNEKNYLADYVVIATGTKPKPISVRTPNLVKKFAQRDIKRIFEINGKHIVIIGAGDAAFDHAIYLSRKNRVSIINRGAKIRALNLLVERALKNEKIEYFSNTEVDDVKLLHLEENKNEHVFQIKCSNSIQGSLSIDCDELIFAIGRDPQLDIMDRIVENDSCILVGDAKNGLFRQASIAIGDGIMAAMKINNNILSRY